MLSLVRFLWCRQKKGLIFKENFEYKEQNYKNHKRNPYPFYPAIIFLMQSFIFSIGKDHNYRKCNDKKYGKYNLS